MEKSVVYEYSHKGLGRPVKKDERSENEKGNSNPNKSAQGSQINLKEKVKNDRQKVPNPLANQNIKNVNNGKKSKELTRPTARNDSNKSSVPEKSSLPKTEFVIPPPRAPLPPSFEMEIDDDCLSTVTVAAAPTIRPSALQSNSTSSAKPKERTNSATNEKSSSGTSVDDVSPKSDCKKDTKSSSSEEAKLKVAASANAADKLLPIDKQSLQRITDRLQKDETWKKKVTESFKSFLQMRNKTAAKSNDTAEKITKSANTEETKESDRPKGISVKRDKKDETETSTSTVNRKDKSRNSESVSSSSRKTVIKEEKGVHDNKKGISREERHEASRSKSHRHQDASSKEEPKKNSSSKSPRDSSGHRQRHNSGKSHSSRSSVKEKKSAEPESRKRKAGSPDHSKSIKKEKVESREKSHEGGRRGSESRTRKSKKELKEISRIQKSLFESENEDERETTESKGIKTEKVKYHKKSVKSKESKSGKAHSKKADPLEVVVLSSDSSSDVSPERPHRSSKGKTNDRRSSNKKQESHGRPKSATVVSSSEKESKRDGHVKEPNSKETVKKSSAVIDNLNSSMSLSDISSKESLGLRDCKTVAAGSPSQNVDKISKKEIDKNMALGSSPEILSGSLITDSKNKSSTTDAQKSSTKAASAPNPVPDPLVVTKSEIVLSRVPIVSLVDICKSDNKENREITSPRDDFTEGNDISDGEVDIENLEATLNISSFPQDFACSSSAELAEIMNTMDYDEDDKEIGKYAKLPGDSSGIPNDSSISNAAYLSDVNDFANCQRGLGDEVDTDQISLDDIDLQQDFPVLSIPDPTVPIVDHSEESEEDVPLIRIRTDLFTESLENASASGISPNRVPEKQSTVPLAIIDNQTLQTSKIVEEVRKTIADVLTIGTSVQQKLSAALEALKCHSDALSVNNFDSEKSEQSLNCFKTILQLGSQQVNDKVKRHSNILAVHNDNFATTEMQMDKAANYFAIVVLINVMIADSLYDEFVTELMGVRYRILCILKVYFNQLIHALHGETWYFHVNSIVQGKLTSTQYEAWNLVANKSWAILKSFDETPIKITPIYEHRVIGCEGFKEIVDSILMSVRRKVLQSPQAVGNSEVDCIQDILNAIFTSANGIVPATQVNSNVGTHESTMIGNTASSYLNNCSLVYSPVSVSPISPPNCTNYGSATSVTTTSAPMAFRENMANNMSLSSYTPSTMSGGMNIQQHQAPSNVRPASGHYHEPSNQNFTVTNNYDSCATSSFASDSICLPMTGSSNGNVSMINHSSQQAPSVQPGTNYYSSHNSQLYGMNSNEFNMYSPQLVNRTTTPQVQMRSYSVMSHQNVSYPSNQVNLARQNQHPARMQQRMSPHVLPQSGNQYQGQTQSNAYLPTTCDRYQPTYNAIHALSTITGNQGMVQTTGNDSLSAQPQSGQLNCHSISSPQSTLSSLISTDSHSHYQNDADSACQATKSAMMHQQNGLVQGTPQIPHHVMARSISMPIENPDQSSVPMLDRRSSFESFPIASATLGQQNNVSLSGSRVSNVGDSGLFLKVLRE